MQFEMFALSSCSLLRDTFSRMLYIQGKHVVIRTADPRNKNQQSTSGGGDSGASSTPVRDRLEWDDARRVMGSASGSFSSPYGQFGMPGSYSSYGNCVLFNVLIARRIFLVFFSTL